MDSSVVASEEYERVKAECDVDFASCISRPLHVVDRLARRCGIDAHGSKGYRRTRRQLCRALAAPSVCNAERLMQEIDRLVLEMGQWYAYAFCAGMVDGTPAQRDFVRFLKQPLYLLSMSDLLRKREDFGKHLVAATAKHKPSKSGAAMPPWPIPVPIDWGGGPGTLQDMMADWFRRRVTGAASTEASASASSS